MFYCLWVNLCYLGKTCFGWSNSEDYVLSDYFFSATSIFTRLEIISSLLPSNILCVLRIWGPLESEKENEEWALQKMFPYSLFSILELLLFLFIEPVSPTLSPNQVHTIDLHYNLDFFHLNEMPHFVHTWTWFNNPTKLFNCAEQFFTQYNESSLNGNSEKRRPSVEFQWWELQIQ